MGGGLRVVGEDKRCVEALERRAREEHTVVVGWEGESERGVECRGRSKKSKHKKVGETAVRA